jgi:hypothetical protein
LPWTPSIFFKSQERLGKLIAAVEALVKLYLSFSRLKSLNNDTNVTVADTYKLIRNSDSAQQEGPNMVLR